MKVYIKTNYEEYIPKLQSDGAAGYDVFAKSIEFESRDRIIVNTGIKLQIPKGYRVVLIPRSNICKTNWILQNSPGLIDSDYRGDLFLSFRCIPTIKTEKNFFGFEKQVLYYEKFPYFIGQRVGQLYMEKNITIDFLKIDELEETKRGEGGFGSTGK